MKGIIKILILEDSPDDVNLIERELKSAGMKFTTLVVKTQPEFENAINTFKPHLVLSDHSLPQFNSIDALKIVSAHNKRNDTLLPFILVSGTVPEEFAIQMVRAGADDFILKDRLKRLPSAIVSALEKSASENDKARYVKEIIASEELMRQAERLAHFGSWHCHLLTNVYRWSDETFRIYGYEPNEVVPDYQLFLHHLHPEDRQQVKDNRQSMIDNLESYDSDFRIIDTQGRLKHISSKIVVERDEAGNAVALIGVNHDITQRKEAELLLQRSRQEYKSLFDQNPDPVCSFDLQGNFTKVNSRVIELSGLSEEALLALNFKPFIAQDDAERVQQHFDAAVTGKPQRYEVKVVGPNGSKMILDMTNMPIIVDNRVIGIHGVANDITEKVSLQRLLENAYKLARIGGWEADFAKDQVTWSPMTKELHEVEPDFTPDFKTGISFYKEGKDRDTIVKAMNDTIELGIPFDVELRIITAKGNLRWVRSKGQAQFNEGKCTGLSGSLQDIHEKKSAEETTREAYQEKINILESIGDAFFAVDKNWAVTYWNGTAETLLGMPKESIIGKNLWQTYPEAVPLASHEQFHKAVSENVAVHFEEYYPPLKLWLQISAYPSPTGLSVYFHDITASRNYAIEIEQQNARLTEIAWALSHDVRGPLARMMGLMQVIKKGPEYASDFQKVLPMMSESADELDNVIRGIVRQTEDLGFTHTDRQLN